MKGLKKIKAGAIQYVLVISVVIMIILFAFISLVFLQKRFQQKSVLYQNAIQNTYQGFDYISQQDIPYDRSLNIQFSKFDNEETKVLKKRWGLFDLVTVSSQLKNELSTRIALMGNQGMNRKALYLKDNNQPLKVVGNTKIIGDVLLPRRGVSTGNIGGRSYYGEKLIYGTINTSSTNLPRIKNLEYVKQLVVELPFENLKPISPQKGTSLRQSFQKETLLLFSPLMIDLSDLNLSGNMVIKSDSKIKVSSSSELENVILIAPKIEIASGFKGTLQAFATKQIKVSRNVRLRYPSVLAVLDSDESAPNNQNGIQLEAQSEVRGMILYHNDKESSNYNIQVQIEKEAKVFGEVYCNRNLELKGIVNGFVYTNSFIAKQFGGAYINHIYDGEINALDIPEEYSGLFQGTGKTTVAKWVN